MAMVFNKKGLKRKMGPLMSLGKKEVRHLIFLIIALTVLLLGKVFSMLEGDIGEQMVAMDRYDMSLRANSGNTIMDSVVSDRERKRLLFEIEERIVKYLFQIPDYTYMTSLETYFRYSPGLLDEIPSCTPLQKGNYRLSSAFGYRVHPITGKSKKHMGLDFAAPRDKKVYATASGTVVSILRSKTGYGTHIIIRHRFGFRTLYGHLTKILVGKGQFVKQHELIGTVGSSGDSTGYHLHYEISKNGERIDPIPSLDLKRKIILELIEQ
jgi:murein DD-endopeptidase MepM/ murein hydrolase activator NlpD